MLVVNCPLKLMQGNSRWRQTTSSPHFSSGIVERAWKSSHARKARRDGESFFLSPSSRLSRVGWFFTRARVSLALLYPWAGLIPEEKWGLLVVCAAGGSGLWLRIYVLDKAGRSMDGCWPRQFFFFAFMDQHQQVETESRAARIRLILLARKANHMSHVNTNQGISPLSAFVKAFFSVILVS